MKTMLSALALLLAFTPQAFARGGQKAIYGAFDNEFISLKAPDDMLTMATGIAYLVTKSSLTNDQNGQSTIRARSLKDVKNICESEQYSKNKSTGNCTGFLVGEDIVVTAGHCIKTQSDCDKLAIAFGVTVARETSKGFSILNTNIYSCKKVLSAFHQQGVSYDYAVIQLDRQVKARHVFELGDDAQLTSRSEVSMLGHPMGLAVMYTQAARVSHTSNVDIFRVPLDSFGGNSGSPVFNRRTQEVMGILTGGQDDFEENGKCRKYARYQSGTERITRISHVKELIENYNRNY